MHMTADQAVRSIAAYHENYPGVLTSKYKRKSMLHISKQARNRKVVQAILEILA